MFQLTQPSGYFQRTLFFSPKSLCLFAQCAHWTQSGPHRSTRDWRPGLGLEIHMQGLWQEPPGKRMIDVQLDTCSSTGGASKTWVLTAWRSLPLPAYYEALGMLQRNGVCYVHGTWGYQSNSTRHGLPGGENGHQSCGPCVARPWNYRISNIKDVHNGGGKEALVFHWQHKWLAFCPNLR